jgi:hypothetical protein
MKFDLICDESGTGERYLVVGGLTLPRTNHKAMAAELAELKKAKGFRAEGEFKWGKVSKAYLPRYEQLLEWFFQHLSANHLRFRAHVVDTAAHAYRRYGEGDKEKAFYKVYYHLLFQSVRRLALEEEGSNILVLLDDKTNRYPFRLPVLKKTLNAGLRRELGRAGLVANVEPRPSSGPGAEPLIQIADVLIGAIGYVRNGHIAKPHASPAKAEMVRFLEGLAGTGFAFDTAARAPFNLWTFDVSVALERRQHYQKKNRSTT